jgi:serine phosphatase RsbU (regulator of sigma subunit)
LLRRPGRFDAPLAADLADALNLPAEQMAKVDGGDGVLVTTPVGDPGSARQSVLTVLMPVEPDAATLAELRGLTERLGRAIAAATVYEERSTLARTLRESLAPLPLPDIAGVQLGATYRPALEASQIGGDFYDVTSLPDGRHAVSIGDVCGKGVEAAVLTGQVRQSLRTAGLVTDDPAAVLSIVNETMRRANGTTYVTATYGVLTAGEPVHLHLAAGGHPPGLVLRGVEVSAVPTQGTLIGLLEEVSFATVEVELERSDVLVLYTDGAPEARGPSGLMGMGPVIETLRDCADMTAQSITERLMQRVMEHLQGWPHDDVAILAVRAV